ncbi:MAG: hypothetical protein JSR58_01870 [Verrucomicrobia bacterium]|nr:hypothetical protein [Verrucomicrobiota bacterium]
MKTVFLFGEAQSGQFRIPTVCPSLEELLRVFGHPPAGTEGISYAIQTLLFKRDLIFFRIEEEGFSIEDYMVGLQMLRKREIPRKLSAICMPGVGNATLIEAATCVCHLYRTPLLFTPKDLYDYLTLQS